MTIADIVAAAYRRPSAFQKALTTVLLEECEFEHDGITIRSEHPDSHGLTYAGLNEQDDKLPVDSDGNITATPEWIANTYAANYWSPCRCDALPFPLNVLMFCQAVNQGDGTEIKFLQRALNDYGAHLTVDGTVGQQTLTAAMQCPDSMGLALAFLAKSRSYYTNIVDNHPEKAKNLQGWFNRLDGLKKEFCDVSTEPIPSTSTSDLVVTPEFLS